MYCELYKQRFVQQFVILPFFGKQAQSLRAIIIILCWYESATKNLMYVSAGTGIKLSSPG